jgi:hypothetical protein
VAEDEHGRQDGTVAFERPQVPPPSDDEREVLLGFLRWKRAQLAATADGLTEDQLRWTPPPGDRLLPILGILNHVRLMEWRWVEGRYLGSPFPAREDDEFRVAPARTGALALAAYAEQAQRTERIVRAAETLDAPCLGDEGGRGAAHELFGFERPVSLRWVLLHVLDDTSHHAGHADATRELLDGRRMSDG